MSTTMKAVGVAVLPFLAAGCFVVDDAHLAELRDAGVALDSSGRDVRQPDAPTSDVDLSDAAEPDTSPAAPADDRCGADPPATTLSRTTEHMAISTMGSSNFVTSSCGAEPTIGADAFLAIDVQAGEYWHFHLAVDPTDPASVSRRPALYLLHAPAGSCDERDCGFSSDSCDGSGDEHFGFIADAPGRWYLGIDDREAGGGRYLLDAIRPVCGDENPEHGEACDDGNKTDGDGCSRWCTWELSTEAPAEIEPNDNPAESNFLVMPPDGTFTVDGAIGGAGVCRYADTFALDVPPGATVEVDPLASDGTPCADAALTMGFELVLRNPARIDVVGGMTDAMGCATVRTPSLMGGRYYLVVATPEEIPRAVRYKLRVRVLR